MKALVWVYDTERYPCYQAPLDSVDVGLVRHTVTLFVRKAWIISKGCR